MLYRDLVVLFPSHGLEDFPTDLPDEKAAGLLNAFAVAWHPSLIAAAKALPREQRADNPPAGEPGRLILVPPACQDLLPAGWLEEARAAGGTVVVDHWEREALLQAVLAP